MAERLSDPSHEAWLDLIERHADWIARASEDLADAAFDAEETEQAIARWIRIGHAELGPDINMHTLLSCIRLPPAPTGSAADVRLRRRRAQSEAAFGAVLRAHAWQEEVLYLCPGVDGLLLIRLHCRTLMLMESEDWQGGALDAAKWVVTRFIADAGLHPVDRPVPRMEDIQRRAYQALSRDIDMLLDDAASRAAGRAAPAA